MSRSPRFQGFGLENMCKQYESNQNSLAGVIVLTNHSNLDLDSKARKVIDKLFQDFDVENFCNVILK